MKRGLMVLACVLLLSFVSATSTEITVKTLPYHEVQLTAYDANTVDFITLDREINESDEYGDFVVDFDLNKKFNLKIFIKKEGRRIIDKDFRESYVPGEPVYVEVALEGWDLLVTPNSTHEETNETESEGNETVSENNETESEENQTEIVSEETEEEGVADFVGEDVKNKITGFAIFKGDMVYYVVGVLLLIGIIIAIIYLVMRKKKGKKKEEKTDKEIKIKKLSDYLEEKKEDKDDEIAEAEKRLREAKEAYNKAKNKTKIQEMERRIKEEMEELDKLKKGE